MSIRWVLLLQVLPEGIALTHRSEARYPHFQSETNVVDSVLRVGWLTVAFGAPSVNVSCVTSVWYVTNSSGIETMNASSSESHPVATNTDSRQATGQGRELTRVGRFFAAAGVCVPGGRTAGGGGVPVLLSSLFRRLGVGVGVVLVGRGFGF